MTNETEVLRNAMREALLAFRQAEAESHRLAQIEKVRPWTPDQAARAAAAAQEAIRLRGAFEQLSAAYTRQQQAA